MFENKGYTYVSVLVIFLLLSGTTWNMFFLIKNFKEQNKVMESNSEITKNCISLSKEYVYKEENNSSFYEDNILYIIRKESYESLAKVTVSAYKDSIMREKVINYKYLQMEVENEDPEQ